MDRYLIDVHQRVYSYLLDYYGFLRGIVSGFVWITISTVLLFYGIENKAGWLYYTILGIYFLYSFLDSQNQMDLQTNGLNKLMNLKTERYRESMVRRIVISGHTIFLIIGILTLSPMMCVINSLCIIGVYINCAFVRDRNPIQHDVSFA